MQVTEALGITIEDGTNYSKDEIIARYPEDKLWVVEGKKRRPNETNVAKFYRDINMLVYYNGTFYSREGICSDEYIRHEIWEALADAGMNSNTTRVVGNIFTACTLASTVKAFKVDKGIIPFVNGNLYVFDAIFKENEITTTPYRFNVELTQKVSDTPYFHNWLNNLFEEEDQLTLQEYLGYCLIPTTKCQKALFLVGEGGAGKSGLGVILQSILGDATVNVGSTDEFLKNRFMHSELEHKLVLYDDDLNHSALSETGFYKKLITNTLPITVDKKHSKPYKFIPQVKLIACCNDMLTSLYDRSGGFYRRLLPLTIKPISDNFVPDPRFYEHLENEAPGIVVWALQGLSRLMKNNWKLHESQRTKDYMNDKRSDEDPFPLFMESTFVFETAASGLHTRTIQGLYNEWCLKNAVPPLKGQQFQKRLKQEHEKYGLRKSDNVVVDGKRAKGYIGLSIKDEGKTKRINLV